MSKERIKRDLLQSIEAALDDAAIYPTQAPEFIAEAAGYGVDLIRLEEGDPE